jgi:hypothetical protein
MANRNSPHPVTVKADAGTQNEETVSPTPEAASEPEQQVPLFYELVNLDANKFEDEKIKDIINRYITNEIDSSGLADKYNILILGNEKSLLQKSVK